MAASLAPERVMVETDSPYLAPVPHRGRRNEPAFVVEVGRRLAEVWSLKPEAVAASSTSVFRGLFGFGPEWPSP
jgi:TatD DNase family protein